MSCSSGSIFSSQQVFSLEEIGDRHAERMLLGPVYTGKAFAGLLDLVEKGQLGSNEPIIFLYTGGLPALFAFDGED